MSSTLTFFMSLTASSRCRMSRNCPSVHLALERPKEVISLTDFGCNQAKSQIVRLTLQSPISFAYSVLKAQNVFEVAKQLEVATTSPQVNAAQRRCIQIEIPGDLCLCPEITDFISEFVVWICAAHYAASTCHLNYAPKTVGKNIDKWHVDTLRYDYLMFVTDPAKQQGGAFQYFKGTGMRLPPAGQKAGLCLLIKLSLLRCRGPAMR